MRHRIGVWDGKDLRAHRVPEHVGAIKGDPSFAVVLERPGGGRIEMRALKHDQPSFDTIQMLLEADDAAAALKLAQRLGYRKAMYRRHFLRLAAQTILALALLGAGYILHART